MNIKLFIKIGILHNLTFLSLPFFIFQKTDVAGIIIYYALFILYMLVSLVITAVGSKRIPINLWFFRPEKRIYSEWGEYWIDIWDKKVVYQQKKIVYIYKLSFFSFSKVAELDYKDNLESMKLGIKNVLSDINYKEKTVFDDWDGYLDKQSERENKLNKILKT